MKFLAAVAALCILFETVSIIHSFLSHCVMSSVRHSHQHHPNTTQQPQTSSFVVQPRQRVSRFSISPAFVVSDESKAAAERAQAAMDAEAALEQANQQAVGIKSVEQMDLGGRPFPLSMIVGMDNIKQALLLSSVNLRMGGVVISGGKGTAKSVMARALHQLLPPIEVLKGSPFNIDPEGEFGIDDFTRTELDNNGTPLSERETEVIPCPFVQVPLNVMEDRLIGSADLEESVRSGKTVFSPGLLAKAHRGVLYVDDINLLDAEIANILLNVVTEGYVTVEREGLSLRYPCKPLLIATFNPDEGELRDHLLDRIAIALSADADKLDISQRVDAVESVLDFQSSGQQATEKAEVALQEAISNEEDLKTAIVFAREYIKDLKLAPSQIQYLCEEAIRAGCQGHRAEIFAVEVARASAALEGRQVNGDDLKMAVKLAIAPRGTFINTPMDQDEMMPPPPPPPPPPQQLDEQQNEDQEEQPEEDQEEQDEPDDEENTDAPDVPEVPQEFMFDADATPIDPDLIQFATRQKSGVGGGRGLIFSQDRGRYIKPMLPKGKVVRLAVDATLRASAPYQKSRRERAIGTKFESRGVHIEQSDVRIKKMARKAGSLIIFVVDASGSMALNRMNAAKGAAVSLLTEAYQSRDKISLIPFQGEAADVLLPPTKSITMARKRLEQMPCGGGSPLAHAIQVRFVNRLSDASLLSVSFLQTAMLTGLNAQKSGDVGKVVVVLISDGRANVPLAISMGEEFDPESDEDSKDGKPSRKFLKEEVIASAKKLGALPGFNLLCIDTENKFISTGLAKNIADAAMGKYHQIAKADGNAIASVTNQALNELKSK